MTAYERGSRRQGRSVRERRWRIPALRGKSLPLLPRDHPFGRVPVREGQMTSCDRASCGSLANPRTGGVETRPSLRRAVRHESRERYALDEQQPEGEYPSEGAQPIPMRQHAREDDQSRDYAVHQDDESLGGGRLRVALAFRVTLGGGPAGLRVYASHRAVSEQITHSRRSSEFSAATGSSSHDAASSRLESSEPVHTFSCRVRVRATP